MEALDITRLRLAELPTRAARAAGPQRRTSGRFLKGPIPIPWLARAACLPGRAFHVAVALCYRSGIARRPEVRLTRADLDLFGVGRFAAYRAVTALERARLVTVVRHVGRYPLVTLVLPEEPEG